MLAEMSDQGQQVVLVPAGERQFGRYQLIYRFAAGGMASIFLGRFPGPDGFEKLVAIKRIHPHLTSLPQFVAMFKDEARLAARISHPNVVQVLELGQCNGAHFIAMEYVEGESLSALLRRARVPYAVAARIIADALSGLHAAHELRNAKGELLHLVHRDLSPSNILISYEGVVKVVDFGVARARGNLSVTDVGTIKGKFSYMSPEQCRNLPLESPLRSLLDRDPALRDRDPPSAVSTPTTRLPRSPRSRSARCRHRPSCGRTSLRSSRRSCCALSPSSLPSATPPRRRCSSRSRSTSSPPARRSSPRRSAT